MTKKAKKATARKAPAKRTARKAKTQTKARAKKTVTSVNLILDESGSMHDCLGATISSVNEYVGSLKNNGGKVLYSLTKFNTLGTRVDANMPISEVKPLTVENYQPDGGTPLYDAVGRTILALKASVKTDTKVLVAIVTDGEENQSKEFTREQVATLLKEQSAKGWTFVYLGSSSVVPAAEFFSSQEKAVIEAAAPDFDPEA